MSSTNHESRLAARAKDFIEGASSVFEPAGMIEPGEREHGPDHVVIPGELAHRLWAWSQTEDAPLYWEHAALAELLSIIKRWEIEHARI